MLSSKHHVGQAVAESECGDHHAALCRANDAAFAALFGDALARDVFPPRVSRADLLAGLDRAINALMDIRSAVAGA